MCGRTRCTLRPDDVARACGFEKLLPTVDADRYHPSYNVSPGSYLPVVRNENAGAVVHCMKWGLVPSFTRKTEKPDHFAMFNARSESLRDKASFRRLLPSSRCLLAVEGFYEWKKDGRKKQPYYIHFKNERNLVFAALFDRWQDSTGDMLFTFTILTTQACKALQWLHDRMPVILSTEEAVNAWLNDLSSITFESITQPYEGSDLAWYPVTPAIGRLQFDGPECIREIKLKSEKVTLISDLFSKKDASAKKLVQSDTAHASETEEKTNEEAILHRNKKCKIEEVDFKGNCEDQIGKGSQRRVITEEGIHTGVARKNLDIETDSQTVDTCDTALKKSKCDGRGDKQQTLHSYFLKK